MRQIAERVPRPLSSAAAPPGATFRAFITAAPAALGLWMLSLFTFLFLIDGIVRATYNVPYILMGGLLFGLPLVIATLLLLALPGYLVLRYTFGVTLPAALAAGALCGLVAREVVRVMWAEPELSFVPVPVVLVTGLGTAWVWWRTWTARGSDAEPPVV